jgi:hypothetical protein
MWLDKKNETVKQVGTSKKMWWLQHSMELLKVFGDRANPQGFQATLLNTC